MDDDVWLKLVSMTPSIIYSILIYAFSVSRGDYAAAAAVRDELRQLAHGNLNSGTKTLSIVEYKDNNSVLPERVTFGRVRLLALGKPGQVAGAKGKGKRKPKGDGKGKVASAGKGKELQDAQSVYFGDDDGNVVCTMMYGAEVKGAPSKESIGSLVDVSELRVRPGQRDMLIWTPETRVSIHLEPMHTSARKTYPYENHAGTHDFVSWSSVKDVNLGDHVSVALKVLTVEEKYTWERAEPYLEVTGRDHEYHDWLLRLWSCEDGDVRAGCTYMFRGLKVTAERVWDEGKWQYVPGPSDGERKVEFGSRSAYEEASWLNIAQS